MLADVAREPQSAVPLVGAGRTPVGARLPRARPALYFCHTRKPKAEHAMKHRASGLTLVELLITLTIAAILAAIGVPALHDFIRNGQLGSQAGSIVNAIALARTEAVRQNRAVRFCRSDTIPPSSSAPCTTASSGSWKGWIVWADIDGDGKLPSDPDKYAQELIKVGQVTVSSMQVLSSDAIASVSNTIVFGGDSLARDASGALVNGQIRVCIPTAAGKNVRDVAISAGGKTGTTFNTNESCEQPPDSPSGATGNPI